MVERNFAAVAGDFLAVDPAALVKNQGVSQIVAHRGGGAYWSGSYRGPFPEETLEGFGAALAAGLRWFNPHICMLADGTLALMHDATPDRTCTVPVAGVDVSQYTVQAWRSLTIKASGNGQINWGTIRPPLLSEYLDAFGGKAVHVIEVARRGTQTVGQVTSGVVEMLKARGLTRTAILQAFTVGDLAPAAAVGIPTMYLPPDLPNAGSDAGSIQTAMTAGNGWATGTPKYVGINFAPTGQTKAQVTTYIQSLVAAGFTVFAYGLASRYDTAWVTAAGASLLCVDEPVYLSSSTRVQRVSDPLAFGQRPHGLLTANDGRGAGVLVNGGVQLDYTNASAAVMAICYGGFSPPPSLTAYTVQADVVWDTLDTDSTRWVGMQVGCPDDRPTSMTANVGAAVVDGYQLILRQAGTALVVTRNSQAAQTLTTVLNQTTGLPPAATAGTVTTFKVQVTATQLIVSLIQGGVTYGPWTVTDSTYRGGYFHVAKAWNNSVAKMVVTWKNVTCG